MKYVYFYLDNIIGNIGFIEEEGFITKITLDNVLKTSDIEFKETNNILNAYNEIKKYLDGQLYDFSKINIKSNFSNFEDKVFKLVNEVPYGKTISYTDIAIKLGKSSLYRAVSRCINKNPFVIVIPTHRVINKNGKIGKFVCDTDAKGKLIELEKNHLIEGKNNQNE